MNPKGALSNGLDSETHLQEGNALRTEFWLGGRFFARFGVIDSRPFTGCNRVAYLEGIPIGATAARFALLVFFKPVNNGRFNLALSSFPASAKLVVVVVAC